MTTRIGTGGPSTSIATSPSAIRVTPAPGQPFKSVMSASARAILSGAEQAVTHLPGGPILAAALRPGAGDPSVGATGVSSGGVASPGGGVGSVTPEGSAGTGGLGSGAAAGDNGVESALRQSADQNLYFIDLQERISAESRSYSAQSNVLKARHDTVKNAIGNIR